MNTLTTSERKYLKYILSEMLKKGLNVMYGDIDEEKIFIGSGHVARIFDRKKVPFDLSKNFRDGTRILKNCRCFSDMKSYKLTSDMLVTENMRKVKLVSESDESYVNEAILKQLGPFKQLLDCEFKASNNVSIHFVFKDEELIGFILPVRI